MFWGLPINVAAEPALLAAARPKRNGRGSRFRALRPAQSGGVIAKTTMSLTRKAESVPLIGDRQAEKTQRLPRLASYPGSCSIVEAAGANPRGENDQAPE